MDKEQFSVLIASADGALLLRWREALNPQVHVAEAGDWRQAVKLAREREPELIVLDGLLLRSNSLQALTDLTAGAPDARVLLMEEGEPDTERLAAIKAGVVGYCERNVDAARLCKAVAAIRNGEVWLPRALIAQLIDEIAATPVNGRDELTEEQRLWLNSLTARELEVARMVYQSANNKVIARELNISERTVKAHLSAIFKKLRVSNRVRLALFFKSLS